MVCIVDYGVGNLFSLRCSLKHIGAECRLGRSPEDIEAASHILLPGVGAFGDAAEKLRKSGLAEAVTGAARHGKPLLGVCLGMQLLYERSFEFGEHEGLGLIQGTVKPLRDAVGDGALKIPHIGWSRVTPVADNPLLPQGESPYMYFVHSFYAEDSAIATARYGDAEIGALVGGGNVFGAQFHPEKSGGHGLRLLKAFCDL